MCVRITLWLSIAAFTSWYAVQARSGVLVTFPKTLLTNTTEKVCFTAKGLEGELTADLSVTSSRDHDRCSEGIVQWRGTETDHCLDLPPITCAAERPFPRSVTLGLTVSGWSTSDGETVVEEHQKNIIFTEEKVKTFIQSDKPIYQPEQKVMFRVLTVKYPDMTPQVGKAYRVWVTSPSGTRMQQWRNQASPDGLLDLDFALSSEPELGTWLIHVSKGWGEETRQQFTVEEYVLPKFEVTITTPPYIIKRATEDITIAVCAKYTYGHPVRGIVNANVSVSRSDYPSSRRTLLKTFQEVADDSGCASLRLLAIDVEIASLLIESKNLNVRATFTERGTDVTMSATSSPTPITDKAVQLEIQGPDVFKPGLPYEGQIRVTHPDGSPAPPHNVSLSTTRQDELFIETDVNGIGRFRLEIPTPPGVTSVVITAQFHGASRSQYEIRGAYGVPSPPTSSKKVTAWFSPSGSFLDVAPIMQGVTAGQSVNVQLNFTLPQDEAVSEIRFYYRIISRGRIISGHSHTWTDPDPTVTLGEVPLEVGTQERVTLPEPDTTLTHEEIAPELAPYPPMRRRETQFSFEAAAAMSPVSRILVYYIRDDGEVVSASGEFKMAPTFENQVSVQFLEGREVRPGHRASIGVSAMPGSLCAVGVVDKSVHIMGGENQLTKAKVFDPVASLNEIREPMSRRCPSPPTSSAILRIRSSSSRHADNLESFRTAGVDFLSNFELETRPCWITRYTPCTSWYCGIMYRPVAAIHMPGIPGPQVRMFDGPRMDFFLSSAPRQRDHEFVLEDESPPAPLVELRSYFPETWLWKLSRLGPDGRHVTQEDIPHTITDWVANAFCVSADHGVGVADSTSIRAFQPFFLSYTIPYSVIRGEKVPVKVTVFNYLSSCLSIQLSMTETTNFTIQARPASETVEVCGSSSETLEYEIVPIELGDIPIRVSASAEPSADRGDVPMDDITFPVTDAIEDTILVEPEGAEREETFSELICPSDSPGNVYQNTVPLSLPTWFVEGSARGRIQVIGDIMGPAMSNLDGLLRMPFGCGEQNMIFMAPNIYVMQYLTLTHQLTPELEGKAMEFLHSGYQRELKYQLNDGSYSAFGQSDGVGSTWLTAFVLKCFSQARDMMDIDNQNLARTRRWLARNPRDENGCVTKIGRVIHTEMQGSVSSPVTMTAFVTIALLEAGAEPVDEAVIQGLECIKNGLTADDGGILEDADTYTLAISSYALGLGEYYVAQSDVIFALGERFQGDEHLWYWSKSDQAVETEESMCVSHCHADSSTVEITSYVLLAYLHQGRDFGDVMSDTMPITKWLNTQRNSLGGFGSTQDTVLGLQALSQFASRVYDPDSPLSVNIDVTATRAPPQDHTEHSFEIQNSNRLVLQREDLAEVPTELNVTATGSGCVLFQAELRYNVPVMAPNRLLFDITTTLTDAGAGNGIADPSACGDKTLTVCVQYTGNGLETGMATMEIKMVSGYIPHEESLNQFQSTAEANRIGLKRFDKYKPGSPLSLYFDKFDSMERCIPINLKQQFVVKDAKDAVIKVYDYYKPGVVGFKKYNTCEDLES